MKKVQLKSAFSLDPGDKIVNIGTIEYVEKYKNGVKIQLSYSQLIKVSSVFYPINRQILIEE